MGLYRDETGRLIEIDDRFAEARGYEPATPVEAGAAISEAADRARVAEQDGVGAGLHAFGNRVNSALTLGATDVVLGETLTPFERDRVLAEQEAHPYLSVAGDVVGTIGGALAAPGSALGRTPTGYLSAVAQRGVEQGLERGGLSGYGRALTAMGAEGSLQSAGQYLGHVALEDKEATAEGLAGALGAGFAFGAAGGGAALGVAKGTMAARRMYSRVMDGKKAAQDAASTWTNAAQEAFEADQATARAAEVKLNDIRKAKMEAQRYRNEARATTQEERIRAAAAEKPAVEPDFEAAVPTDVIPREKVPGFDAESKIKTNVRERPDLGPEGPVPLDEGIGPTSLKDGPVTSVKRVEWTPEGTKVLPRDTVPVPTKGIEVPKAGTTPVRMEAVRSGRPSERKLEVKIWKDGAAEPEVQIISAGDADNLVRSQLPDGFNLGPLQTHAGFEIETGIPMPGAVKRDALYVVRPSELAMNPVLGNTLKEGGVDSIRAAWKEGKKLAPIDIDVMKDGRLHIEDGNHRLVAAAADDRPVVVRFRETGPDWKPQAGAVDVADRLKPSALESQLAGTKAKLDKGAALKDIKASKGNADNTIEKWIAEKKAFDNPPTKVQPHPSQLHGPTSRAPFSNLRRQIADQLVPELQAERMAALSEIRYKATEDLLGPAVAKKEQRLMDAIEEFKAAKKDMDGLVTPADEFAEPQKTGKASPGNRQAVEILDDAHEEALLRAKHAADPSDAGRAILEADELERLLENMSKGSDVGGDAETWAMSLYEDLAKVKRYEKASADLADALAEEAHPLSTAKGKAVNDAERDAERKMYERAARATDDMEHFGPEYKTPKERVRYARERQSEAQRAFDETAVQEKEAGFANDAAKKKVREGEKAKAAALREDARAARAAGKVGAADVGGLMEIVDIPGMPKPSDLPFVGPLLGAYLKFRTLKKAMGRMMGRVPATADARVAALANQTRDRIARAVDRSLGVLEKAGKSGMRAVPPVAGILAQRVFDDGGENPPKSASITKLAAARMREVNSFVTTPNAIEMQVRRELRDVTDPDVIAYAEKARRSMWEYIQRVMPKVPDQGLLNSIPWEPSPAESMSFARRLDALNDPAGVYERLAESQAMMNLEASEVMREVYPKLFQQAQQRVLERAGEGNLKVPYRTRVQMAVLFKLPALEPSLDPANFAITQSVYERKPSSPAYNPAAPGAAAPAAPTAQPAIANPVNISQEMTPTLDRR